MASRPRLDKNRVLVNYSDEEDGDSRSKAREGERSKTNDRSYRKKEEQRASERGSSNRSDKHRSSPSRHSSFHKSSRNEHRGRSRSPRSPHRSHRSSYSKNRSTSSRDFEDKQLSPSNSRDSGRRHRPEEMTRKPDPHEEWRMIRTNAKRSSAPKSSQSSASSEAHSRKEPVKVPMAATLLPHLPQPPPSASITLNTLPTLAATINAASNAKRISQEEKRKMLWGQPEKASSAKVWEKMKFSNDDQTEKFRKLMGIKSGSASSASSSDTQAKKPEEEVQLQQKQETIFRDLNKQYEVARMSTHTHRGIGLGFGSSGLKD